MARLRGANYHVPLRGNSPSLVAAINAPAPAPPRSSHRTRARTCNVYSGHEAILTDGPTPTS
jgi:hypothetical protein